MKGAGDAGPGVAAGSIIGDHHADDALIAVFGAACAESARLDTEATHAVRRGTMYALDDRIGQLRTDCARLAAELAAARAEVEAARGDALEEAAKVADRHWDGMVVPEARGGSEVSAAIRALKTRTPGGSHGD